MQPLGARFSRPERVGNGWRYVPEAKTSSSRRNLDVPTPLVEILARHLEQFPTSEWVFTAPSGDGFLWYHNFRKRFWIPAVKAADLAPLTFHELRHTAVALLIDQGADLFFVSRFVGHSDIRTTANPYGHLFPQRGEAVADLMGSALRDALARRVGFSGDFGSVTELPKQAFGSGDALPRVPRRSSGS